VDPRDFATDNCSIARTLEVVGEKWTFLVLREVFRGVRRFDDIRAVTGAPRQVLADRLAALVDQGILRREPYREPGRRERQEYRLTDKGLDLYPVLVSLLKWGNKYGGFDDGPPLELTHKSCGHVTDPVLVCSECGEELRAREVRAEQIGVLVQGSS